MSLFQFHPESATIHYLDNPKTESCPEHTVCTIEGGDSRVQIFLPYLGRLEVV